MASRKRIRDFEDVADSDDEFHINRDRVLLAEEPDAKRRRQRQEQEEFLQPSDEEVLKSSEDEEEDDDVKWGMSKGEIYGADDIETEEQALAEEAEALRLQKKQLQSMSTADYGFDETEWQDSTVHKHVDGDVENVVTEVLPQLQLSEDLSPAERLKILKSRYPEFEPLSKELLSLQETHTILAKDTEAKTASRFQLDQNPNAVTKLRACSAYLGTLTMYFALLTSSASGGQMGVSAMSTVALRDHAIMEALVKCRELWVRAKGLPDDPNVTLSEATVSNVDLNLDTENSIHHRPRNRQEEIPKKSRAQRHAAAAQAASEERRAERMQRTEAGLADLDSLLSRSKTGKTRKQERDSGTMNSDFGEDAPLTAHEAAEKAKRKKSLRFYTSQIAQKANKRGAAGRNAGGDDDIPYRERLKDRQARLNVEAEKRGQRKAVAGAELGGESDEEDVRQAQEIRTANPGDNYYDLVAARTAKRKADKAAFAEAQRQAALEGGKVIQEEAIGLDGKRKITYAIEKNKGLTPHRKKDVRNPRVKKRKKFDEKKKKLASIKPTYKGGEGRGGYGGELTGIKKGLVKSTKL